MKKKEECKGGIPEWMATYADMVTLLMCFFVLLFAFSNIDAQKFEQVMQSFQGSAGILSGGKTLTEAPFVFDGMPEDQASEMEVISEEQFDKIKKELENLDQKLSEEIQSEKLDNNVQVIENPTSLVLRFKDSALFEPLSADLKTEAIQMLSKLTKILQREGFNYEAIIVEGHTDNMPFVSEKYTSDWNLSADRAAAVVKYLVSQESLDPYRVVAAGYGSYRPIATNTTEAGRAINRRVDIIIKAGGASSEKE